jgi:hypothetical protein
MAVEAPVIFERRFLPQYDAGQLDAGPDVQLSKGVPEV